MLEKTAAALRRNKYEVSVFETKEEATSYLNGLFQGNSIGFGDSSTLVQLGLYASLRQNNTVIDPAQFHDHDSFNAAAREALTTEYFSLLSMPSLRMASW